MAQKKTISRRSFLKVVGAVAGGIALEGCLPHSPTPAATVAPSLPPFPAAAPARVAIAQANSYDPKLVLRQVQALFDSLGGLQDVVWPGDKVAVKLNLSGGVNAGAPPAGTTPTESYVTHPAVAQAIGELLLDSGAKNLTLVESVSEWASFTEWGYEAVAKDLGATLVDLNRPDPYPDFGPLPVGKDWFIYESLLLNRLLQEVDVFVSVAKMKCHYLLGITQSMKNLVGLAPYKLYQRKAGDGIRSGFHGADDETKTRLPRVVLDLNRARPVNLALIDGIKTVDGGEGPWLQTLHALSPGVLVGGKNPVSTDAVAVAAMGFDPAAEYPDPPFLGGDNHLNLARQLGLGTNRLSEIEILGANLDDVKMKFRPAS